MYLIHGHVVFPVGPLHLLPKAPLQLHAKVRTAAHMGGGVTVSLCHMETTDRKYKQYDRNSVKSVKMLMIKTTLKIKSLKLLDIDLVAWNCN